MRLSSAPSDHPSSSTQSGGKMYSQLNRGGSLIAARGSLDKVSSIPEAVVGWKYVNTWMKKQSLGIEIETPIREGYHPTFLLSVISLHRSRSYLPKQLRVRKVTRHQPPPLTSGRSETPSLRRSGQPSSSSWIWSTSRPYAHWTRSTGQRSTHPGR